MTRSLLLSLFTALFILPVHPVFAGSDSIGFSYGKNFYNDNNIEQYALGWNHELPWLTTVYGYRLTSSVEMEGALIDEDESEEDPTWRFSVMPQAHLWLDNIFRLTAGFGAGVMAGETEFIDHDLGGPFFFNAKLGVEVVLQQFSIGYYYYHQSNAGIYEHNASLNMNCIAAAFHF
ncbi:acyloxyacyl hydrolase [Desulforhopalus vacuolatus]|uniref:acyloxyacyl hydrolase n=1 Tax=Desulforhopalus vacuolatus TaxID=40414 RepID=UPI001965CA00|nr:acyloxyacyl hydrolase [Desulforhopalus vacuolatus]MBM9519468.1 acyloxyacyl hydrolase [Desulforhopalus vacuolatus]